MEPLSPIIQAIDKGDHDTLSRLLAREDPNRQLGGGDTLLHLANRDPVAVALLIEAGAFLDPKGRGGRTPLHCASDEAARVLIRAGADPHQPDDDGMTPFGEAVQDAMYGHPQRLEAFIKAGAYYAPGRMEEIMQLTGLSATEVAANLRQQQERRAKTEKATSSN